MDENPNSLYIISQVVVVVVDNFVVVENGWLLAWDSALSID